MALIFTIIVLIDFRKAFKSVDHPILLIKIYHYVICGIAYDWIIIVYFATNMRYKD